MDLITTTPFGRRPVTAGLIQRAQAARQPVAVPEIDKWSVLRELCAARHDFGITDRDLTVLNALLSFHPETLLRADANLIVFPSNRALGERAHGMAESTLRRHLAALCDAGVIVRHDSPNGKRFAARRGGAVVHAFGFDLRPLLVQAARITNAANAAREHALEIRCLRVEVGVMARDAGKFANYARQTGVHGDWNRIENDLARFKKILRRKLNLDEMKSIRDALKQVLEAVTNALETEETGGSNDRFERHHQNSNKDLCEKIRVVEEPSVPKPVATDAQKQDTNLPVSLVIRACPDIMPYATEDVRHWHQLVAVAGFVRGMLGINHDAWEDAQKVMGPQRASITVAAILQRAAEIRQPGAYLRALTRKAKAGAFSPGPMIMALLGTPKLTAVNSS